MRRLFSLTLAVVMTVSMSGCLGTMVQSPTAATKPQITTRVHILAAPTQIDASICKNGLAETFTYVPLWGIVVGVLFLLTMFFSPLVEMIGGGVVVSRSVGVGPGASEIQYVLLPVVAPVMILVGCLMVSVVRKIDWDDPTEALPAFLVILGMPLTYNIANGFALGFISYPLLKLVTGRGREVSWLVYALGVLLSGTSRS